CADDREKDLSPRQLRALSALRADDPAVKLEWHGSQRLPRLILGQLTRPSTLPADLVASDLMPRVADVFGFNPQEIGSPRETRSDGGLHIQYDQVYQGLPVYNAGMLLHMRADGAVSAVSGLYLPSLAVSPVPTVAANEAATVVKRISGAAEEGIS